MKKTQIKSKALKAFKLSGKNAMLGLCRAKLSVVGDFNLTMKTKNLIENIDGFDAMAQNNAKNAFEVCVKSLDLGQLERINAQLEKYILQKGGVKDVKLRGISTMLFGAHCKELVQIGEQIDGFIETMELVVNCGFAHAQTQEPNFNMKNIKDFVTNRISFINGMSSVGHSSQMFIEGVLLIPIWLNNMFQATLNGVLSYVKWCFKLG